MDRILNFLFIFALIGVFVLVASAEEHHRIILGALFSGAFCIMALLLNWLSLDGARAATVLGTFVFGLGGMSITFLVLFFFLSSSALSRKEVLTDHDHFSGASSSVRRDGLQVWSNGFWLSIFLLLAFIYDTEIFWLASVSALATATADTWATELGSKRFSSQTWKFGGFIKVEPGTDGGVSLPGTAAAMAGSLFISFFAIYLFSLKLSSFFIIFTAGFLGCLADSYFGATLQGEKIAIELPFINDEIHSTVDNNTVNWLATGVGSLTAIILTLAL